MEEKRVNNVVLKYNGDDWNKSKSRVISYFSSGFIAAASMISILIFILCVIIGKNHELPGVGMFIGLILMMVSLILLLAMIERKTYGKEIAGFRVIDWFYSQDSVEATYQLSGVNITSKRGNEHSHLRIEQLLKQLGCKYTMEYKDRYKLSEETPVNMCIDATKKDVVSVNIERAEVV